MPPHAKSAAPHSPAYRRRVEIPIYSFEKHQRLKETAPLYSPHILILEGILALNDPRILKMLDMKVVSMNLRWKSRAHTK